MVFFFQIYLLEKIVMQQHCCCEHPSAGPLLLKQCGQIDFCWRLRKLQMSQGHMRSDLTLLMAAISQSLGSARGSQTKARLGASTYSHSKKRGKITKRKILYSWNSYILVGCVEVSVSKVTIATCFSEFPLRSQKPLCAINQPVCISELQSLIAYWLTSLCCPTNLRKK